MVWWTLASFVQASRPRAMASRLGFPPDLPGLASRVVVLTHICLWKMPDRKYIQQTRLARGSISNNDEFSPDLKGCQLTTYQEDAALALGLKTCPTYRSRGAWRDSHCLGGGGHPRFGKKFDPVQRVL